MSTYMLLSYAPIFEDNELKDLLAAIIVQETDILEHGEVVRAVMSTLVADPLKMTTIMAKVMPGLLVGKVTEEERIDEYCELVLRQSCLTYQDMANAFIPFGGFRSYSHLESTQAYERIRYVRDTPAARQQDTKNQPNIYKQGLNGSEYFHSEFEDDQGEGAYISYTRHMHSRGGNETMRVKKPFLPFHSVDGITDSLPTSQSRTLMHCPLSWALWQGDVRMARLLTESGADAWRNNKSTTLNLNYLRSMLDIAVECGLLEILTSWLESREFNIDRAEMAGGATLLHYVVKDAICSVDNSRIILFVFTKTPNPHVKDSQGWTPLNYANQAEAGETKANAVTDPRKYCDQYKIERPASMKLEENQGDDSSRFSNESSSDELMFEDMDNPDFSSSCEDEDVER
ncbi:hypothetical protein K431DRAFT_294537 [Polychaeton citri CBS 116435]|uniref:Ankyrin n=1 Tax=Polychaeton citri CBS 116435 TaxID=1314669 RepID=A0A9P4QAG2_9PEZI|nr:hypothetical protein K431DRAFT_294537 [Polychaeton citri CBS 116435]